MSAFQTDLSVNLILWEIEQIAAGRKVMGSPESVDELIAVEAESRFPNDESARLAFARVLSSRLSPILEPS